MFVLDCIITALMLIAIFCIYMAQGSEDKVSYGPKPGDLFVNEYSDGKRLYGTLKDASQAYRDRRKAGVKCHGVGVLYRKVSSL